MKGALFIIIFLFSLSSCFEEEVCFETPTPPHGQPDYEYHWANGGMEYRTYIYECYEGRYIEATWSKFNVFCWEETEYFSYDCE